MKVILEKHGLEFEMYPNLEGHPDFLIKPNIAVFCDSSFWHGRDWKKLKEKLQRSPHPKYWIEHISRNRRRDKAINEKLAKSGCTVLRFWDTEVFRDEEGIIERIKHTQVQG